MAQRSRRSRAAEAARACLGTIVATLVAASAAPAASLAGRVVGDDGKPIVGAMVTAGHGWPLHERTVFTDDDGRYRVSGLVDDADHDLRVRRIGWKDARVERLHVGGEGDTIHDVVLARETDPAAVAAQLPANRWYDLALSKLDDDRLREQLKRQCTYCHQQGSRITRQQRSPEEWDKVLTLMGRMGAGIDPELRARIPELFNTAYDPATAVPTLTARMNEPDFAPAPPPEVRRAVIDEYGLGSAGSMQHDIARHPGDGRIYSVDMLQDVLYRLDPAAPDGTREEFKIPRDDVGPGGAFGSASILPANADARVGPHSVQVAPDGGVWITLAIGNQLARFDPVTTEWRKVTLQEGFYPHTLRFDGKGRVWYSIAVSNQVGMFDPATGEHRTVRLPARSTGEEVGLRLLPAIFWLARKVDIGGLPSGEGDALPVPYGVDIAPDGAVWVSQLNAHRIVRIDPATFEVEVVPTPFTAPRRMRFDSKGTLWIPGFSSSVLARFDPKTHEFKTWSLPTQPQGSETPYALNVDRRSDTVWICGTESDTLIRFEPATERFTVYPLPTQVTYTRELDFDEEGRVWTSNSNLPGWQIETGVPRILRLDPGSGTHEVAGD